MNETKRMAAVIGANAGIDPVTALTILAAAAQALMEIFKTCHPEVEPVDGLRDMALTRPMRLARRVRLCAREHGLSYEDAERFADELVRQVRTGPRERMAAVCAEHLKG
jgi:hypothetical protein